MKISLQNLGKKYNRQWIFRHLELEVGKKAKVAITGHNGSGKSTLLKIIGGYVTPSEGKVALGAMERNDQPQTEFSIAAPYLNLIDEFTLTEHLDFHGKFKRQLFSNQEIAQLSGLGGSEHKMIRDFSSGMKQRLRLSLAFFYESKIILLDEPTSNLDDSGVRWYLDLINTHTREQTVIIASNQKAEYDFCEKILSIEDYK